MAARLLARPSWGPPGPAFWCPIRLVMAVRFRVEPGRSGDRALPDEGFALAEASSGCSPLQLIAYLGQLLLTDWSPGAPSWRSIDWSDFTSSGSAPPSTARCSGRESLEPPSTCWWATSAWRSGRCSIPSRPPSTTLLRSRSGTPWVTTPSPSLHRQMVMLTLTAIWGSDTAPALTGRRGACGLMKTVQNMMTLLERIKTREAQVVVVGAGYVGLPLAVEVAKAGVQDHGLRQVGREGAVAQQGRLVHQRRAVGDAGAAGQGGDARRLGRPGGARRRPTSSSSASPRRSTRRRIPTTRSSWTPPRCWRRA